MGSFNYSTLIVNDDPDAVDRIAGIASALGESVAVVDNRESFLKLYTPTLRCIVLELSMPRFCGVEIIRHLADTRCRATLVLTTGSSPDLLHLARKLAVALGITVADVLVKPFELDRVRAAMINATDPAVPGGSGQALNSGPQTR